MRGRRDPPRPQTTGMTGLWCPTAVERELRKRQLALDEALGLQGWEKSSDIPPGAAAALRQARRAWHQAAGWLVHLAATEAMESANQTELWQMDALTWMSAAAWE
ncbi:MAG: hypothetical protein KKB50_21385 [Planctomycetes bacterium]|nr:hypothetical protein [Planctomycetota bacterium]